KKKIKANRAAAALIQNQLALEVMGRKSGESGIGVTSSPSAPQPHQAAQQKCAAGNGCEQNPLHTLQLALGHHDAILDNRPRTEAFEQLRAFQQPIECITGKVTVG